ncbi:hypothetical protein LCM10_13530 [Rossellomorea aquimaris]|nr:hypothetical protein [Rossellomorea aquimaris]MCA1056014.1 hypothetical protein [Rossellomorea aquimaris]
MNNKQMDEKEKTIAGTDIAEVKKLNQTSGLTYNQVKELLGQRYSSKK